LLSPSKKIPAGAAAGIQLRILALQYQLKVIKIIKVIKIKKL